MENLFKAVGVVEGEITFNKETKEKSILIDGKKFSLLTIPTKQGHRAITALKEQVKNNGTKQRLLVYPRVLHLPAKEIAHTVAFSVVGFQNEAANPNDIYDRLKNNEFLISGLFQRIPVCRYPVLTVFKNLTEERVKFISQSNAIIRAGFMKANHIPIRYDQPIVPPYIYYKDKPTDQQDVKHFLEIKTLFNVNNDLFVFDSLLNVPRENPPKFLHVSKNDKRIAIAEKRKIKYKNESERNKPVGTTETQIKLKPTVKPKIKVNIPMPIKKVKS